jgi:hypothetical protein
MCRPTWFEKNRPTQTNNFLGSTCLLFTAYITDPSHNYGWHLECQNSLWTDTEIVTMLATFTDEIQRLNIKGTSISGLFT